MDIVRVGICQINSVVGDIRGNYQKIINYANTAKEKGCHIAVFPELALCGYPPEDLVFKKTFLKQNEEYIRKITEEVKDIILIVGFAHFENDIFNSAGIIYNGKIEGIYNKIFLPNYGVFDEERHFTKGKDPIIFKTKDFSFGVTICEDIWYPEGPAFALALAGAELIININASPYHIRKWSERENMLSTRAKDYITSIVYCNLVGGQDEVVFDGHSFLIDEDGKTIGRGKLFEEDLLIKDVDISAIREKRLKDPRWKKRDLMETPFNVKEYHIDTNFKNNSGVIITKEYHMPSVEEEVFLALKTALKDYFYKNNFKKGVIGLSGGIDSSLVAGIAVSALGKDNVVGVFMPSMFTSRESYEDARKLAENLGIRIIDVPITGIYNAYIKELKPLFEGLPFNSAEENIQARIRGNILMALSNKFGWLVITTGNKSEMSCGYATLYGDMAGGFALLKDVPKTLVYKIGRYYNELNKGDIIPERIFTKAPTAELRENQKDQDTLPPYDILDKIITAYVEEDKSKDEIIRMGIPEEIVLKTIRMIDINEYKRRQSPPGVKITERAFGKDRRMPITNRFQE
ncbi:MAG: NAD+ synthase [Proteobacteria bacterium]|nr:NAD+ synthase [Pseudomonadota bacterium]